MPFSIFPGLKATPSDMISLIRTASSLGGSAGKNSTLKVKVMAWTTPVFEEVVLCCEINSYVSAQL